MYCIISLNLISTEAIIYSILELQRNDIFLTFRSRCIGNSFTHILKILFEYYSIVNRLHFMQKKISPGAPDIWEITKNLVAEHTHRGVYTYNGDFSQIFVREINFLFFQK